MPRHLPTLTTLHTQTAKTNTLSVYRHDFSVWSGPRCAVEITDTATGVLLESHAVTATTWPQDVELLTGIAITTTTEAR